MGDRPRAYNNVVYGTCMHVPIPPNSIIAYLQIFALYGHVYNCVVKTEGALSSQGCLQ